MLHLRIAVGSALFLVVCATFWLDFTHNTSLGLIVLVIIAATLSLHELYRMAERRGLKPFSWVGLAGGIAILSTTHWWGWTDEGSLPSWRLAVLAGGLVFACFLAQALRPTLAGTTANIAVTMLGVLYVPFMCAFFIGIDHLANGGAGAVLFVVFVAKGGDIGAYAAGRWWGGPRLAPVISPNKTIAGAIGGLLLSALIGTLIGPRLTGFSFFTAFWASVVLGVAAQLGDLCESMIKRDLEVKDAGNNLPGFGGVLDLMDCLLTAAPTGYIIFQVMGP